MSSGFRTRNENGERLKKWRKTLIFRAEGRNAPLNLRGQAASGGKMEKKSDTSQLLSQEEEVLGACVREAGKILARSSGIFEDINRGFKDIEQKNASLRKQMAKGARKTDGSGSFLL